MGIHYRPLRCLPACLLVWLWPSNHCLLIGLSIERPILDHHPKAHIHKIRRISPWNPWNPADFMKSVKSGGFHEICEIREIRRISPRYHLWNPPKIIKASVLAKTLQFDECRVGDFTLEIWWISPEIWWISTMKSGGFHQIWPVKSTQNYKSKCFSKNFSVWWMQGGRFHPEIWWISPVKSGRLHPDFTCEIHPKL